MKLIWLYFDVAYCVIRIIHRWEINPPNNLYSREVFPKFYYATLQDTGMNEGDIDLCYSYDWEYYNSQGYAIRMVDQPGSGYMDLYLIMQYPLYQDKCIDFNRWGYINVKWNYVTIGALGSGTQEIEFSGFCKYAFFE